jgi:hypothetical protein
MAETNTPEQPPAADGAGEAASEIFEFTDRRGALIVLVVMLLPVVIVTIAQLIISAG